jgi:phosphoribosylanthranilate isomerase
VLRVKICGITRLSDAKAAVEAGADALGFVFAKSARRVTPAKARSIVSGIKKKVVTVGVFVDEPASRVLKTLKYAGLDAAQLHGDEPASDAERLKKAGFSVIKAVRVAGKIGQTPLDRYPADALLFDTASPGMHGGTGQVFDWKLLKNVRSKKPVIVSGGLKPSNVGSLLKVFKPYAVDVSSGVESAPGKKNASAIRKFVNNAKKI